MLWRNCQEKAQNRTNKSQLKIHLLKNYIEFLIVFFFKLKCFNFYSKKEVTERAILRMTAHVFSASGGRRGRAATDRNATGRTEALNAQIVMRTKFVYVKLFLAQTLNLWGGSP